VAGKSAIRDAPALTTLPPAPPGSFVSLQHRDYSLLPIADTTSMTFRHHVLPLRTPDAPRGRVMAASRVFARGGPQSGQVDVGAGAAGFGAPFSVISGGVACVLTMIPIGWKAPAVRRYRIEQ